MQGIVFKVYDGSRWYLVDSENPAARHSDDAPDDVVRRADSAIMHLYGGGNVPEGIGFGIDPTPYNEAALRGEFDGVEFVSSDWTPYRVY